MHYLQLDYYGSRKLAVSAVAKRSRRLLEGVRDENKESDDDALFVELFAPKNNAPAANNWPDCQWSSVHAQCLWF